MSSRVAAFPSPRRGWFQRRKGNRRVVVQRRAPLVWLAETLSSVGRVALAIGRPIFKGILVLGSLAAIAWGGRWTVRHVVDSPRFAVAAFAISPTVRLSRDEVLSLVGVAEGDRLLTVDTDAVAARLAAHPWVASARARRRLPATLEVDVVERQAVALVTLGGLYIVDERGHPFKRATMAEAEGLPVITGLGREQYATNPALVEAALREGLSLLEQYRTGPVRPALSEVALDVREGVSLFLLDGGAEIRLGRGDYSKKLARLDRILEAWKRRGPGAWASLKVIHLDGGVRDRVAVRATTSQTDGS